MVVLTRLGPPEEGIHHTQPQTSVHVNDKALGTGTLYISEARVSWMAETRAGQGFSLEYPHIALHAISKDLLAFPSECLYLMIDVRLLDESEGTPNSTPNGSDNEDDEESVGGMTEIRWGEKIKETSIPKIILLNKNCAVL